MSLSVKNLTIRTSDKIIIDDVSVRLLPGKSLSIIGPSASGKTTLVKAILGLNNEFNVVGNISFDDLVLHDQQRSLMSVRDRRFGYIPQELALWPHLTVKETISLSLRLASNLSGKFNRELVHLCGLHNVENRKPKNLSGGEKQRLALARALAGKPRLLILDEPFSALDIVAKTDLITIIKDLQSLHGFATVFISHDLAEACLMSSHMMILSQGKKMWLGESAHVTNAVFPAHWNPFLSPLARGL